jgi:hypothetical protein
MLAWRQSSGHFPARYMMEGNGNLHDPAALSPKCTLYPPNPKAEWNKTAGFTATKRLGNLKDAFSQLNLGLRQMSHTIF